MTTAKFYEDRQISPRWRAQEGKDSYQITIYKEDLSALIKTVPIMFEGGQRYRVGYGRVNQTGEDRASPTTSILRMYIGLTQEGAAEAREFVRVFNDHRGSNRVWNSVEGLVESIDQLLVRRDELEKGTELIISKNPNYLYGETQIKRSS